MLKLDHRLVNFSELPHSDSHIVIIFMATALADFLPAVWPKN